MKRCPFCEEQIQDSAIKCRYCGEWLERPAVIPESSGDRSASKINKREPEDSDSRIRSLLYAIGQPIEKVKDLLTSDFVTNERTGEGQRSSVKANVDSVTQKDAKQRTTTSLSQHFKKSLGYAGIFFGLFALAGILIYFDLGEALGKGTLSVGTVTLFYVFYAAHRANQVPYALIGFTTALALFFGLLSLLPN